MLNERGEFVDLEENIKLPKKKSCNSAKKYPFKEMAVGDSFTVYPKQGDTLYQVQHRILCAARNYLPKRFTTRMLDGLVGCWRIE